MQSLTALGDDLEGGQKNLESNKQKGLISSLRFDVILITSKETQFD